MKKIMTLLFLIAAIGVKAQTKITSKALGDQIWLMPGAYEVTPRVIGIKNDTLRSIGYITTFGRDTTAFASVVVNGYSKSGGIIVSSTLVIPMNSYKKWGLLIAPIDNYITTTYPGIVKQ